MIPSQPLPTLLTRSQTLGCLLSTVDDKKLFLCLWTLPSITWRFIKCDQCSLLSTSEFSNSDNSENSSFYGARFGQVTFFNSVVGIEFALVYERGNLSSSDSNTFKAVLGLQIHLEK